MTTDTPRDEAISRVVESATRMGVELDEHEAAEWVAAMETEASGGELVVDVDTGVYGHRVTMLDFQPEDLARFREMAHDRRLRGPAAAGPDRAVDLGLGGAEQDQRLSRPTATSSSASTSRADTREEACAILADLMREKALATTVGPTHRLWEVKFGSHPVAAHEGRQPGRRRLADVVDARGDQGRPDGGHPAPTARCASTPGRTRRTSPAGASSTGSSPTGRAASWPTPATSSTRPGRRPTARSCRSTASSTRTSRRSTSRPESIPLFSKLVKELSADAVDDYVDTLEHEVWKYTVKDPNYGKAARRMYNVFRMNGQLPRGGLHPRAVRRAGDRAVPGLGADPDARRRRLIGRRVRHRHDGRRRSTA